MFPFSIVTSIEAQTIQIDRARAVLQEAENYFENEKEYDSLPCYAEHIGLLLSVADRLLFDVLSKLNNSVEVLAEVCRNGGQNGKAD